MSNPFVILDSHQDCFNLKHGFLPNHDPIQALPQTWQAVETLASQLPKLLMTRYLRQAIKQLANVDVGALQSEAEFERAMMLLSYLGHAYVWCDEQPLVESIPASIAIPWYTIAKHIGRPPVLSYASYALYNWRRIDTQRPIELGNIVLLQNFLGGADEEWFILIHIDIEANAIPALQALLPAQHAATSNKHNQLLEHLQTIAHALTKMVTTLNRMPEHCDPLIYYRRVRPYIHGWKDNPALPNGLIYEGVSAYNNQGQHFKGETGAQSTIIPALDATLGITHADNPLKTHLQEMRTYMPPQHQQFLSRLEQGPTIRDYICQQQANNKDLITAFNSCIKLITEFRSIHLRYAAQYIQKQQQTSVANSTAVGTGGTPFMEYLRKHEQESEKFLIC